MIEEMKSKMLEKVDTMLSNPEYVNYRCVNDFVDSMYRACEILRTVKESIFDKTVKSVEWANSCFDRINELFQKCSEMKNEVA